MRTIHQPPANCAKRTAWNKMRHGSFTKAWGAILLVALLHIFSPSLNAALPVSYSVNLAWDRSPDAEVTGYRIYYGVASGNYTNSVIVGNVATNSVSGLTAGVTYFFAAAAFNASGQESPFSNEISYTPGGGTVQLNMLANKQAAVTVRGLNGHTYEILATQALKTWTAIGTVTLGASGATSFTDINAASFTKRFYRTRDITP